MSKRVPLGVSLTPELAAFVTAKVSSRRHGSASEVVRTSLRLPEGKERHSPASPPGVTQGSIVSHER